MVHFISCCDFRTSIGSISYDIHIYQSLEITILLALFVTIGVLFHPTISIHIKPNDTTFMGTVGLLIDLGAPGERAHVKVAVVP